MLKGKKVLTIVSKDFDDLEMFYPLIRLQEAGATVEVAAELESTEYKGKYGLTIKSDLSFDKVDITKYDALLIPGGWSPDYLRRLPKVIDFVKYMDKEKKDYRYYLSCRLGLSFCEHFNWCQCHFNTRN